MAQSQQEILELMANYPAVWLETLTELDGEPFKLEPYQVRYLNDMSFFRLVNKSRQIGFSTILAGEALARAASAGRFKANIVSINQKEASDKIEIARNLYHSIPDDFKTTSPVLKPVLWNDNDNELSLHRPPATSTIISQPASAAIRGGKKDIYFDEFAHIRDAAKLYKAAMPAIIRGTGRLTIISTPLGQSGLFYDIATNISGYPNYSRHTVPWWECSAMVRPELYEEALAEAASLEDSEARVRKYGTDKLLVLFQEFGGDLSGFQTEFETMFADETTAYFTWDLIVDCTNNEQEIWRDWHGSYESAGDLSIGIDLARDRDQTVFTVVEHVETEGNMIRKVLMTKATQDSYNEQFKYMKQLIAAVRPSRVTIDQTGVGQKFVEDAKQDPELGSTNVEGVVFTNQKKERWATTFKGDMQLRRISWPNNIDLKRQVHGIKRTKTEANFYKFAGPHDDYFWSLMLAMYGEGRPPSRISSL